jgi:hypothetical protein
VSYAKRDYEPTIVLFYSVSLRSGVNVNVGDQCGDKRSWCFKLSDEKVLQYLSSQWSLSVVFQTRKGWMASKQPLRQLAGITYVLKRRIFLPLESIIDRDLFFHHTFLLEDESPSKNFCSSWTIQDDGTISVSWCHRWYLFKIKAGQQQMALSTVSVSNFS